MPIVETSSAKDALVAGEVGTLEAITIASGQNLARGTVLGFITANNKAVLSLAAAEDGSETPVAILSDAVDASAGDRPAVAYFAGEFNSRALVLGAGHTIESIRGALRARGIFLRTAAAS